MLTRRLLHPAIPTLAAALALACSSSTRPTEPTATTFGTTSAASHGAPGIVIVELPHTLAAIYPPTDVMPLGLSFDGYWTPSPDDVRRAHTRIHAQLQAAATAP